MHSEKLNQPRTFTQLQEYVERNLSSSERLRKSAIILGQSFNAGEAVEFTDSSGSVTGKIVYFKQEASGGADGWVSTDMIVTGMPGHTWNCAYELVHCPRHMITSIRKIA